MAMGLYLMEYGERGLVKNAESIYQNLFEFFSVLSMEEYVQVNVVLFKFHNPEMYLPLMDIKCERVTKIKCF